MACVDNMLLYAAKSAVDGQRTIVQLILQRDGVRLVCIEEHAILYGEDCGKVHGMCINGSFLFLSNQRGISRLDLSTQQHSRIILAPNDLQFSSECALHQSEKLFCLELAINWGC